ncbi:Dr1-like protein [Dinothrombium tinctorium]|uniref:Protein Dr1 n=1 Tax=Dinothrombium tinctorium TaxID=1965070 RepID=A0A3S3P8Q0_9ACAR|nr:Dr1-like protein [Dinothrombium tinctorium]RWS14628.1 Dr1-like protein [Dinothrombium tinctorium]
MASNEKVSEKEEEELTIPRAAMNKLIKELVPDIRVANETREIILNCCSEFIKVITTEANLICEEQQKKTMSGEHVIGAFNKLGLHEYKVEAERVLNDCKGKRRRQSTRLEHLGIPEEELLRQQQELFAKARLEQQIRDQQEWLELQNAAIQQQSQLETNHQPDSDDDNSY